MEIVEGIAVCWCRLSREGSNHEVQREKTKEMLSSTIRILLAGLKDCRMSAEGIQGLLQEDPRLQGLLQPLDEP